MAYTEHIPTSTLFHYTNEIGFHGILESGELWLNELVHSNDPRDLKLGRITILRILSEISKDEFKGDQSSALDIIANKLFEHHNNSIKYTVCLSPLGDEINMWREYAEKGRRFSIGFRPRALSDMHGRIHKVSYVTDTDYEEIKSKIREIIKPIEYFGHGIFEDFSAEMDIATQLISLAMSMKDKSWSYEREIRLSFSSPLENPNAGIPISMTIDERLLHWVPHRSRQKNSQEIKYHSFPFGKYQDGFNDKTSAVSQIVIGPNCEFKIPEIEKLMHVWGYNNFEVTESKCAFR